MYFWTHFSASLWSYSPRLSAPFTAGSWAALRNVFFHQFVLNPIVERNAQKAPRAEPIVHNDGDDGQVLHSTRLSSTHSKSSVHTYDRSRLFDQFVRRVAPGSTLSQRTAM